MLIKMINILLFFNRVFSKFKESIRLIPANIQRETTLDANSARDIFPALQPIYRYVKVRICLYTSILLEKIQIIDLFNLNEIISSFLSY